MFDQFDLKFLDDPKKVYGDLEEIHAIAWKGFSEKDPFAAEFFGNIKLTTEELSSFMTAMKDARMDEEEIARNGGMNIGSWWIVGFRSLRINRLEHCYS